MSSIDSLKNVDNTTCWYREDCDFEMVRGANGVLWPVLEKSGHWPVLKNLLEIVMSINKTPGKTDKLQLLDIGCGAGALGNTDIVKENFHYYGLDLKHVIENVAYKCNPGRTYIQSDILNQSNYKNISLFGEVVVMNAFIDVMQYPITTLEAILPNCFKFVVIHRQFLTDEATFVEKKDSYGGKTYISHINKLEWNEQFRHFKLIKQVETGLGKDNYSFLYQRAKDE